MQTGNGHEIWLVGGRTYTNFKEAVEAQDRRVTHFIRLGGVGEEELSRMPKRVIPEGATAQNYNPEPEWPISQAIDEVLGKKFRLFTGPQLNSGQHETRYLIPDVLAAGQLGGIFWTVQDAQNVPGGRSHDFLGQRDAVLGPLSRDPAGPRAVFVR